MGLEESFKFSRGARVAAHSQTEIVHVCSGKRRKRGSALEVESPYT